MDWSGLMPVFNPVAMLYWLPVGLKKPTLLNRSLLFYVSSIGLLKPILGLYTTTID
jgi:hypothetical protein